MPRVCILPSLPEGPDPGDGGIRRVIEGQRRHLPAFGWEVVDEPEAADVIACHIAIADALLRKFPGKAFAVHNHGLYWSEYEWPDWCERVNAEALRSIVAADVVTAVSEWTAQAIRRSTYRPVSVVFNGIEPEEWPARTERGNRSPFVLWNKTRVDPICDPSPLLELARLLPEVPFVSTFAAENAPPNVEITGKLPHAEARELVATAGVYLCTTRETWGIGTLEALAAGVPVVGFRWGGQAEMIEDGVTGYLVTPGDFEGLAAATVRALREAPLMADACRAAAARYTNAAAAEEYAKIYAAALERRTREGPRVSIIVTAYKMGDYLDACLSSVAAQTDPDFECLIVDDASPDPRDGEIARKWADADPRFRYLRLPENQYLAGARNAGVAASRGRYLLPLDADDQLASNALELLAPALDVNRDLAIAYGGVRFTEEDGKTPTVYGPRFTPGHSGWPMQFRQDFQLAGPGQLLPYCSLIRREAFEALGGYRERARSSEDCDLWLRATSYGFRARMVTEADTLIYRNRPGSMSRSEGWEEHRNWYPWVADRSILPSVAREGDRVRVPTADPPIIAVVIPVGPGHARLVRDAVDSVDAQTFRQWECVVVNDTGEELPPLPSWVRVIEPEGDRFGGVAAARNAGIAAARAGLFLPLDADDYLQPEALATFYAAHVEDPARPVVYCDFWEDPETPGEFRIWQTPDADPESLIAKGLRYAVTCLTPVAYWREVGGYDPDLPAWEDWAFQIAIAAKGRCARRVALPLFTYRKHTGFRRNANLADFEAGKRAMMGKDFGIRKGEKLLACSTCGSGPRTTYFNNPTAAMRSGASALASATSEDLVLIEYTGARSGDFGKRGAVSRTLYTFGANDFSRRRYVLKADADALLAFPDFRIATPDAPAPEIAEAPPMVASREAAPAAAPVEYSQPGTPPAPADVPAWPEAYALTLKSQTRSALEAVLVETDPKLDPKSFANKAALVEFLARRRWIADLRAAGFTEAEAQGIAAARPVKAPAA